MRDASSVSHDEMGSHDDNEDDWGSFLPDTQLESSIKRRGLAAHLRQLDEESKDRFMERFLTKEEREFVNSIVHSYTMASRRDVDEHLVRLARKKLPTFRFSRSRRDQAQRCPGISEHPVTLMAICVLVCTATAMFVSASVSHDNSQCRTLEAKTSEMESLEAAVVRIEMGMFGILCFLGRGTLCKLYEFVLANLRWESGRATASPNVGSEADEDL